MNTYHNSQDNKHRTRHNPEKPRTPFKIDVAGFSHIFNSRLKPKIRLLWFVLCAVTIIVFLKQCSKRVEYYIYGAPIMTTEFIYNANLTFPVVIVCPFSSGTTFPSVWPPFVHERFGNVSYRNAFDLMNKTNMTVADLWNISRLNVDGLRYQFPEMVSLIDGVHMNNQTVAMTEFPTVLGTCWLFKMQEQIPYTGLSTCLHIEAIANLTALPKEHFVHRVMYVSEENLPLVKYMIAYDGHSIVSKRAAFNYIRMQVHSFINNWIRPCVREDEYIQCFVSCIERKIFSKILLHCRLPFMTESSLRLCESLTEFKPVFIATDEVLGEVTGDENKCNCNKKCTNVLYKLTSYQALGPLDPLFWLGICFENNEIELLKESYSYDFWALLSDIGGCLGMFIGLCVLQIFEIISQFFHR